MEELYTQYVTLKSQEISDLLSLFQQAASDHQTVLGSGREEIQRCGQLWMITRQKLVFYRAPVSGENAAIRTWLTEARHGMYLRQYELSDAEGNVLCRAAAVWTLVDAKSRALSQLRLDAPLHWEEEQLPRFPLLRPMETEREYSFTVPVEYLDENGHMNNAHYFDAVAQILPKDRILSAAQVDYHTEACEGEALTIGYTTENNSLLIQGQSNRGLCFRMKLEYQ